MSLKYCNFSLYLCCRIEDEKSNKAGKVDNSKARPREDERRTTEIPISSICQRTKLCVALRDWLLDFIQNDITYLYNVKINVNPTNEHLLNNFNDYQWTFPPDI